MIVTVRIPGLRIRSVANLREHWAARARRTRAHRTAARTAMMLELGGMGELEKPHVVTLVRIAPRTLDNDNLAAAMKAVRDGTADALGIDDRSPMVEWRYAQERGGPREYGVRIEMREAILE